MTPEDEKNLLSTVARMEKRGEKIELALLGSEELEIEGIVDKVKAHGKYIESDKRLKAKIIGGIAVGTPIAVLLWDRFLHFIGWK